MSLQTVSGMTKNERRVVVARACDREQVVWFGYALAKIADLMSVEAWTLKMLDEIAAIVRAEGFEIRQGDPVSRMLPAPNAESSSSA